MLSGGRWPAAGYQASRSAKVSPPLASTSDVAAVRSEEQLTEHDQRRCAALQAAHPAIAAATALAQRFGRILRERAVADCVPWLDDAIDSGIAELRDFARGLRRDQAIVAYLASGSQIGDYLSLVAFSCEPAKVLTVEPGRLLMLRVWLRRR